MSKKKDDGPLGDVKDADLLAARLNILNAALLKLQEALERVLDVLALVPIPSEATQGAVEHLIDEAQRAILVSKEHTVTNLS